MRINHVIAGLLAALTAIFAIAGPACAQDALPVSDESAKNVIKRVDAFYRGLPTVSCTAEVSVKLGEGTVDDKVGMRAVAVRPNRLVIFAIEPHGYFPTNQFVSNGSTLFEISIRRRMFMLSDASADFQGLHARVGNRSAPNVPVETFLALLSENPIENILHLDVEPGLIRFAGQTEIDGVLCDELVLNEKGSKVWVRANSPYWVVRYENSPIAALPRYLPEGAKVTGPKIRVDFKAWSMVPPDNEGWDEETIVPEGYIQMATMHESAKGGPEDGYDSLTLESGDDKESLASASDTKGPGLLVGPDRRGPLKKPDGPALKSVVPEVELFSIDGERTKLSEIRGDRPAAIIFWAKNDKFSRTGLPSLIKSLKTLGDSVSVIVIGGGSDADDAAWMTEFNPAFSGSMIDPGGVVVEAFDLEGMASVVLVDKQGKVAHVYIGPNPRLERTVMARTRLLMKAAQDAESSKGEGKEESKKN